jgi:hypothetical protein
MTSPVTIPGTTGDVTVNRPVGQEVIEVTVADQTSAISRDSAARLREALERIAGALSYSDLPGLDGSTVTVARVTVPGSNGDVEILRSGLSPVGVSVNDTNTILDRAGVTRMRKALDAAWSEIA